MLCYTWKPNEAIACSFTNKLREQSFCKSLLAIASKSFLAIRSKLFAIQNSLCYKQFFFVIPRRRFSLHGTNNCFVMFPRCTCLRQIRATCCYRLRLSTFVCLSVLTVFEHKTAKQAVGIQPVFLLNSTKSTAMAWLPNGVFRLLFTNDWDTVRWIKMCLWL